MADTTADRILGPYDYEDPRTAFRALPSVASLEAGDSSAFREPTLAGTVFGRASPGALLSSLWNPQTRESAAWQRRLGGLADDALALPAMAWSASTLARAPQGILAAQAAKRAEQAAAGPWGYPGGPELFTRKFLDAPERAMLQGGRHEVNAPRRREIMDENASPPFTVFGPDNKLITGRDGAVGAAALPEEQQAARWEHFQNTHRARRMYNDDVRDAGPMYPDRYQWQPRSYGADKQLEGWLAKDRAIMTDQELANKQHNIHQQVANLIENPPAGRVSHYNKTTATPAEFEQWVKNNENVPDIVRRGDPLLREWQANANDLDAAARARRGRMSPEQELRERFFGALNGNDGRLATERAEQLQRELQRVLSGRSGEFREGNPTLQRIGQRIGRAAPWVAGGTAGAYGLSKINDALNDYVRNDPELRAKILQRKQGKRGVFDPLNIDTLDGPTGAPY